MATLEGEKQFHDSLKQLTTLNTGAIGLLVGFADKLFPSPSWKFLIAIAMVLLIAALFFSVIGMFLQAVDIKNKEDASSYGGTHSSDARISNCAAISFLSFFCGIFVIVVFFLRNYCA